MSTLSMTVMHYIVSHTKAHTVQKKLTPLHLASNNGHMDVIRYLTLKEESML